ncbi:MAG: formylglycine-generating enzyme family protein [Spirochaetia bacterium]|nr:formylglycine-generating enzyme family protein [Spirochaetia bacterium]MDD7698064.1 SUMF1/EgtB/PvdO family nonheme iron enzyme [Spirochaetia bacterium]MDY4211471.1 SUMF1/EgtB/PvdO family nonheme iron enzyme [Treponema sp.]
MFVKQRKQFSMLFIFAFVFSIGGLVFAKPKSDLVKQEPGFYYGFGQGSTKEEAEFAAKKDLIENSLTSTLRITSPAASQIIITDEAVKERSEKYQTAYQSKNGLSVAYKIKAENWDKEEKVYAETLRKTLADEYQKLAAKGSAAARLASAEKIMQALSERGETELLTLQDKGTELYARKVESICASVVNDIVLSISVSDGIISPSTSITVKAADKNGKAVADLPLKIVWEDSYMPVSSEAGELAEVCAILKTDKSGNATAEYPVAEEYLNKIICLTVSTALSTSDYATKAMRKIDASSSVDAHYFCVDDVKEAFKTVAVAGGEFEAGAVKQDKRATQREASRKVEVKPFEMSVTPVTNLQYAAYLYLTRSESYPEYFDNTDYNNVNQPVIAVSVADAEGYAKWLSEQTGNVYRLPTDDEWECAARAGQEVIYPWGDDDPSKAKIANYKGNGKVKGPSKVGEFADSTNSIGLVDMAGNVWEWTSSARGIESETDLRTVKGGSWMDGPLDLRISNFKNIDSTNGYPDVGFRLVKEIAQ